MKYILTLFVLLLVVLPLNAQNLWTVAYYPTWAQKPLGIAGYGLPPIEVDWTGISHVVHFFGDNSVVSTAPYFRPVVDAAFDKNTIYGNYSTTVNYQQQLITSVHAKGGKVLIDLQDITGTSALMTITQNQAQLDVFANAVVTYAEQRGYDGVELDWEFWASGAKPTVAQMSALITTLRTRMNASGTVKLIMSAPGIGKSEFDLYNTPEGKSMVDMYTLQMYAYSGINWNGAAGGNVTWFMDPIFIGNTYTTDPKFEGSAYNELPRLLVFGIRGWLNAGFPSTKLGVGLPGFARFYHGANGPLQRYTAGGGWNDEISIMKAKKLLTNGGTETYDSQRHAYYISGTALRTEDRAVAGEKFYVTLPESSSIVEIVNWAKSLNLGAVMEYELSKDLNITAPFGQRNPLMSTIVRVVNGTIITPPPITTFTLAVSQTSGGTITPNGITVNSGSSQTFTITPNSGYLIANVVADGISLGPLNTYTFSNVTTNHTIGASFTLVPPAPVVGRYVDQIFTSAEVIKTMGKQFAVVTDKYGTHTLWMDIYTPPASDPVAIRPCIVWIHGGNFSGGGRADFSSYCIEFARRGYVTATIDYRLFKAYNAAESTNVAVRAAQVDFETAKDYLKSNAGTYRIDPNFFIVGGWSAGSSTSWRASYDYEYVGRTSPSVRAAIPIDAENIKTTDFKAGDPPWLWIQHDYTKSMGDEFPLPYQRAADSLGIINQFTVIPNTTHTELDQNGPRVPEISIVIAKFLADNVIGTVIIPPPPPVVNVCDTAYNRGVLDGKASVVCPPPVVCPPYPDTTTMKANAYALGRMSVICPPIIICPPFPDTVRIRIDGFSDGMAYQKEIGTADSARGYKIGWNDVLNSIPDVISAPSQMISVPKPPPKP